MKRWMKNTVIGLGMAAVPVVAHCAEGETPTPATLADIEALQNNLNIVWTCVAAFLVFFMQAGFAMVETGFTRAKNACNIMMKNLMDFSIGSIAWWVLGFGLMFGAGGSFLGTSYFAVSDYGGNKW